MRIQWNVERDFFVYWRVAFLGVLCDVWCKNRLNYGIFHNFCKLPSSWLLQGQNLLIRHFTRFPKAKPRLLPPREHELPYLREVPFLLRNYSWKTHWNLHKTMRCAWHSVNKTMRLFWPLGWIPQETLGEYWGIGQFMPFYGDSAVSLAWTDPGAEPMGLCHPCFAGSKSYE